MKIAIVGGTGNISTSIVRLLVEQGHEVVCVNRGKTASPPAGATQLVCDRQERKTFEARMQAAKFDAAIDMICFNPDDARSDVRAFAGVSHFVMVSTVCTYGVEYDWLPVSEDHPWRPITDYGRNKVAADNVFLEAFHREAFPVTIVKPSTTIGPRMGLLRQVAWEFSWLDRVRQGMPMLVCGDGHAMHQFLHVDDAALGFAHLLGKTHTLGQVYNMTKPGFTRWRDYHTAAMTVIGREVELVSASLADLIALNVPNSGICREIFAHNTVYDSSRLRRDVPEFQPQLTLAELIADVYEAMQHEQRVPKAEIGGWEDKVIAAVRKLQQTKF